MERRTAYFRHNVTTLKFDTLWTGIGDDAGLYRYRAADCVVWRCAPSLVLPSPIAPVRAGSIRAGAFLPAIGSSSRGTPPLRAAVSTRQAAPTLSAAKPITRRRAHYRAEGLASWYGDDFHGRYTANGEIFDIEGITAAHPTLPMPSYVRVTNLANGRSIIVRVNDRGPYVHNRIIDVSIRAAHLLGFYERGRANVRVEYVGRAPLEGSDDRILAATLRENGPAPAPSNVRLASAERSCRPPARPPPVSQSQLQERRDERCGRVPAPCRLPTPERR